MHRSRLSAMLIDCSSETMEAGVQFWHQALGLEVRRAADPASPYVTLEGGVGGLQLSLQRVQDTSRIHVDIETDDMEAEIRRLERLGARRKAQVETWWIMEDPCGHPFCVVPVHSNDFAAQAHVWEE
jgi:predicted enzyme related to lactoylglutathione lyase